MKERHRFTEPPPPDTNEPDWPAKFAAWLGRKAAHYNMGPLELFGRAIGCRGKMLAAARKLDEKARRNRPGRARPNGGITR